MTGLPQHNVGKSSSFVIVNNPKNTIEHRRLSAMALATQQIILDEDNPNNTSFPVII